MFAHVALIVPSKFQPDRKSDARVTACAIFHWMYFVPEKEVFGHTYHNLCKFEKTPRPIRREKIFMAFAQFAGARRKGEEEEEAENNF